MSLSRRRFIAHTALAAMAGPIAARRAHAEDLPALPADNATAVALAYNEDVTKVTHASFKAGSLCNNCNFYTGAAGSPRGPCSLFPGYSVSAKGWCAGWAKKA